MNQFLEAALQPINMPYTMFMMVVLIYWLTVILGVLDFSFLDFDVDVDADVDVDVDADVDADSGGSVGGALAGILLFFNIGTVPFMIVFSFLIFFMWSASVFANYYLNNESWGLATLMFPAFLIGGLFFAKFATAPFVKMFESMYNDTDVTVIGKVCLLMESADSEHIAHAKVTNSEGLVQMVNVKTSEGEIIEKGSQVLIISYDEEQKCYIVADAG